MSYRESDIVHECSDGQHCVIKTKQGYTVFKPYEGSLSAIESDSTYTLNSDGLSLAVYRCNYLAKRFHELRA